MKRLCSKTSNRHESGPQRRALAVTVDRRLTWAEVNIFRRRRRRKRSKPWSSKAKHVPLQAQAESLCTRQRSALFLCASATWIFNPSSSSSSSTHPPQPPPEKIQIKKIVQDVDAETSFAKTSLLNPEIVWILNVSPAVLHDYNILFFLGQKKISKYMWLSNFMIRICGNVEDGKLEVKNNNCFFGHDLCLFVSRWGLQTDTSSVLLLEMLQSVATMTANSSFC